MSLLRVTAACRCCVSLLCIAAACCCCMSLLRVAAVYPCCVSQLRVVFTLHPCRPHERTWPTAVPEFLRALHKVQAKAWQPPPSAPPPIRLPWHRGCVTCQGFGRGFGKAGRPTGGMFCTTEGAAAAAGGGGGVSAQRTLCLGEEGSGWIWT